MTSPFQFLVPPDANDRLRSACVADAADEDQLHGLVPYMVVWVDTRKVVERWRHDNPLLYEQRDPTQMEEIFRAMTRTGNEYMPVLAFSEESKLQFIDGSHRMLVFRDCDYEEVPVVVPATQAKLFETRLGLGETPFPSS